MFAGACVGVFLVARRCFGRNAALVALVLYGFCEFDLTAGSTLFERFPLQFFCVWVVYCTLRVGRRKRWAMARRGDLHMARRDERRDGAGARHSRCSGDLAALAAGDPPGPARTCRRIGGRSLVSVPRDSNAPDTSSTFARRCFESRSDALISPPPGAIRRECPQVGWSMPRENAQGRRRGRHGPCDGGGLAGPTSRPGSGRRTSRSPRCRDRTRNVSAGCAWIAASLIGAATSGLDTKRSAGSSLPSQAEIACGRSGDPWSGTQRVHAVALDRRRRRA